MDPSHTHIKYLKAGREWGESWPVLTLGHCHLGGGHLSLSRSGVGPGNPYPLKAASYAGAGSSVQEALLGRGIPCWPGKCPLPRRGTWAGTSFPALTQSFPPPSPPPSLRRASPSKILDYRTSITWELVRSTSPWVRAQDP